ncbi:MAG: hypothetical protein CMJ25_25985 [Phycisphaerae bacterium]|nr:hypothetical protein [Phycisphaerae bacterium]
MPVPIGYGLYVLGNVVVRAIIKTQGKKLISAGFRKVSESAAKKIAKTRTGGVIKNATSGNVAGLIRNARTVKTRGGKVSDPKPVKSRTVKTRKGKVTDPKPTKSRTVKTKEGKVTDPKPTNLRTVKTRGGKVTDPKPTGSRTVKTRGGKKTTTRPTDSKTLNKKSLLSGTAIGVVSTLNVKKDKEEKPSKITEGSRTVKTRGGKGNTVDKSKTSPKPKLRPKNLKKPAAGPVSNESFGAAFKRNRKAKKATFTFKDKLYTTRIKEESIAEHKKKFGVKGKYK